ncbi:hypothetical protein BJ165DRAFT_889726 [Panaeolus papilionaceus]|nr:hypothetical protein BJ165DRAFT_889726 [Panaeolus papilionaceus]
MSSAAAQHLLAGKYFQGASYAMLVYDHLLTLDEEVERIWKQKFSGATILFLLNRYGTLLSFIVVIDAFVDSGWTKQDCHRFVMYEGAQTIALVGICELIMILRVYALYGRSIFVIAPLLLLLSAQIIMSVVGIHTGWAVPLPSGLTGCILDGTSVIFPSIWVSPLITDSCIFGLTLWRTRSYILSRSRSTPIMQIFLRDGTLYFFAIFSANFINFLAFILAPSDLKAVGASFSQIITSLMVSRLVLNLRAAPSASPTYELPPTLTSNFQNSFWDV